MLNTKNHSSSRGILLLSVFASLFFLFSSCNNKETFKGYLTTAGKGKDEIKIVVVKGTPYEMGFQLGNLLKNDIDSCLTEFVDLARKEEPQIYSNAQLDKAWTTNSPYIDPRIKEEMKGLAEATGIDLKIIERVHMLPVVSPYACSGVAVWGKATETGHTYQLRNLDYTMDAHLQDYPVVVIYVPDSGAVHANVTFAGYIGSNTGMNANHLVFGEKGESPGSEFPYKVNGAHFSFLFRQMMYDDRTLNDIIHTIQTTPLIKRYFLFFSDGNKETQGAVKVLVSTPDSVKYHIWKDNDSTDIDAPNVLPNVIYHTMNNPVAFKMLKENYGQFNSQKMIDLSKAVADEGGNLMDVVYDATTLEMWVAYANGPEDASKQNYIHISMDKYLKEAGVRER